jgi:CHASE3 domain sensor protein
MFVVAAVALSVNLTRQRDSFGWVEHTNEVLRTVSALERRILEAESGERGYLLTGESGYLDSYSRSQDDIPRLLEALRQTVSDGPGQVQRTCGHRAGPMSQCADLATGRKRAVCRA